MMTLHKPDDNDDTIWTRGGIVIGRLSLFIKSVTGLKALLPEYNTAVVMKPPVEHCVVAPTLDAPLREYFTNCFLDNIMPTPNNWSLKKEISVGDLVATSVAIAGVFSAYFMLKEDEA